MEGTDPETMEPTRLNSNEKQEEGVKAVESKAGLDSGSGDKP